MSKFAIIIDPDWRFFTDEPRWADPNYANHPRFQWMHRVRSHFMGLTPACEMLLTAASRPDNRWLYCTLISDYKPYTPGQHTPIYQSVSQTHFKKSGKSSHSRLVHEYKIASSKFENPATKNKPASPLPNMFPVNTVNGLANANAHNDAIEKMITNTKHRIDHIVIIDPYGRVKHYGQNGYRIVGGPMYEVCWAYKLHQALYPSIPLTVIV